MINEKYWIISKQGMTELTLGSIYKIINPYDHYEFHYYVFKGNDTFTETSIEILDNAIFLGRNKLMPNCMEFLYKGEKIGFYGDSLLMFVKVA